MLRALAILLLSVSLCHAQIPESVMGELFAAVLNPAAVVVYDKRAYIYNGTNTWTYGTPVPAAVNSRIWGSAAITVSAWVYATNFTELAQAVYSTRNGDASVGFSMEVSSAGLPTILNRQGGSSTASSEAITTGTWNHIVWSHTSGAQRIYINGLLTASSSYAQTYSAGYCVHGVEYTGGGGFAYYWKGQIAEIALWDRILASNEVWDAYILGNYGTQATNTLYPWNTNAVCIWNYQTGSGTQIFDSANSLTGYVQKVTSPAGWTNAPQPYR
jgi:hypothetical protein